MFFITRPSYDDTTKYISAYSKEIIEYAASKNKKTIELKDDHVKRKNVHRSLMNNPIKFVMFNGHGNSNCITGHNHETIIESPGSEDLLESKIIYCRSCKSGKCLGPDSITAGAEAFIGYKEDFIFLIDEHFVDNPLDDPSAKPFLTPTNEIAKSILKGETVETAHKKSKNMFKEHMLEMLQSDLDYATSSIKYLFWNYTHQVLHGDPNSSY